jgi:hypothetical protein
MADMVDKQLFAELAGRRVEDVVMAPFCGYNEQEGRYEITAWNSRFAVYPESRVVKALDGAPEPHDYFYVFLVNYLLSSKKAEPTAQWISEKDLVGGVTFFRGPHAIPTELITKTFGNDIQALERKCASLHGMRLEMADCSFGFHIVGSVKVALLYWQGDEDFPAEAKLLIDSSIADSLRLDVVFGLLCDVCVRIAR